MTPNDDLRRWGEPPASDQELALAELLGDLLEQEQTTGPLPADSFLRVGDAGNRLLEVNQWIHQLVGTLVERSGLFDNPPLPAGGGVPSAPPLLQIRVCRLNGPLAGQLVATTHARPLALRDLRRVPAEVDRAVLRTGERIRIEVLCDRDGYLTVFNVGPQGAVHVLYPESPAETILRRGGEVLPIAEVELTPPAGNERLIAVWTRQPPGSQQLQALVPGAALRDMQRVQQTLDTLRPEDWHAVLLELDHQN